MGKRLMIVDDSRVMEIQMEKLLEDTEFEVVAYCQDGEKAIATYGEVLPDVVTMDIIMPGLDGLETSEAILEDYPDAKIVMVSSLAYEETVNEAKAIGVKSFVYKPIVREDLIDALETALSKA